MIKLVLTVICMLLSACALPQKQLKYFNLKSQFNENQAQELMQPGTGTIKGNAFLRQAGGGVVTCAGSTVNLIPATDYAKERITMIYGSSDSGIARTVEFKFRDDQPGYFIHTKNTKCDSQGNFQFEDIAAGEFFVTTFVSWSVGRIEQGGLLMHRYEIRPGQTATHVLSQ